MSRSMSLWNHHITYHVTSHNTRAVRNDKKAPQSGSSPFYAPFVYNCISEEKRKTNCGPLVVRLYAILYTLGNLLASSDSNLWKICSTEANNSATEPSIPHWRNCTFSCADSKRRLQNDWNHDLISGDILRRYFGRDVQIVATCLWTSVNCWASLLF